MREIIEKAKSCIPSLDAILEEATEDLNQQELSTGFGKVLLNIEEKATTIFRGYEKQAVVTLAREWVERQKEKLREKLKGIAEEEGWEIFVRKASELFSDFALLVQALEAPNRAFFLACKRTLRERWKQEVPIANPIKGFTRNS